MFSNWKYRVYDTVEKKYAIKKRYASDAEAMAAVERLRRRHKTSPFGRFMVLVDPGIKKKRHSDYYQSRIVYVGD